MPRSASVSVPRRHLEAVPEKKTSLEFEDTLITSSASLTNPSEPREYDSWPCDSFFLLPDAVLAMDAGAFRDDLTSLDPILSASLPDWPGLSCRKSASSSLAKPRTPNYFRQDRRSFTLLDHHEGLTVHSAGKGTVLIGSGGGDGRGGATSSSGGGATPIPIGRAPNPSTTSAENQLDEQMLNSSSKTDTTQKDRSSGFCYKDREERVRQMRERQQNERHQKLEELKEQAAAALKFREQQDTLRRQRLEHMRSRDTERRTQVEERKKMIEYAEQERREAVVKRSAEREHRLDLKRRQERSNAVFAFGSSTPRMLDPKENLPGYWAARRATSTTNVNVSDLTAAARRASECVESDLGRKRATSAHSLNRKPEGDDLMTRSFASAVPTAARRRTDLLPAMPAMRDARSAKANTSPRHRSPGVRSGAVTPSSPSRPTSALSQGSSGSQVTLRARATPRKPRPLSIAGTAPSSADKLLANVPPASRESRPTERKSSLSNGTAKLARAKSVGSDTSAPTTPQKTQTKVTPTPKRTPAQVKAESAAKKALERSKATPKPRITPRNTPLQSPSVESKAVPGSEKKNIKPKETTALAAVAAVAAVTGPKEPEVKVTEIKESNIEEASVVEEASREEMPVSQPEETKAVSPAKTSENETSSNDTNVQEPVVPLTELQPVAALEQRDVQTSAESEKTDILDEPKPTENMEDEEKLPQQKASDKPVTGYANEEEYKAALAEKRRQAREAKERELEMERQRQLEEEERERREERDYLRLLEEQKKAEEERLQKAIIEAEKQREEDAKRKEEEEKQRLQAEKLEQQKQLEAEEKLRKEEEDRQARKSRVAAIMSRTRGKGASPSPRVEAKTPSDEGRNFNDALMSESFIATMSSSMTDSMIVQAIENHDATVNPEPPLVPQEPAGAHTPSSGISDQQHQPLSDATLPFDAQSDLSSQPHSNISSQPLSDVSSHAPNTLELSSHRPSEMESESAPPSIQSQHETELHMNGDTSVPMETTPTGQPVDLLGSFTGVNGGNHNGVHSPGDSLRKANIKSDESLKISFDPLHHTNTLTISSSAESTTLDQIIDLKLANEDVVNSNEVPPPIIAFEDNMNKRQSQDSSPNVPDLLL